MKRWLKACACVLAATLTWGAVPGPVSASKLPQRADLYDSFKNPVVPKGQVAAKKLYILRGGSYDDLVTAGTLQGLLATKSEENLYVNTSASYDRWLNTLKTDYGVETEEAPDFWALLPQFTSQVDGYILCKTQMGDVDSLGAKNVNVDESVNVATTLCRQLNGIVVTQDNEQKAKDAGLECLLDVSDWTGEDLLAKPEYMSKLSKKVIIEQWPHFYNQLRDYAVVANAMVYISPMEKGNHDKFLDTMEEGFAYFGWSDPVRGEDNIIGNVNEHGGYTIATDHAQNLSVLSAYPLEKLEQKTEEPSGEVNNKHTVCFMMTDGDNIQWALNDLTTNERWYGYPDRGQFAMGWGFPSTIIDLAPSPTKWIYDNMTPKDGFILQMNGLGIMYPKQMSTAYVEDQAYKLNSYMGRLDMNILEVIDHDAFYKDDTTTINPMWDIYTKQSNIDGIFYIDYANYAGYNGAIGWSNNKPIISARFNMWTGDDGNPVVPGGGPDEVIREFSRLNQMHDPYADELTTDPTNVSGYSLVMVHCWSHSMADVKKVVDSLDPEKFDVVTPQEYLARIQKNKPVKKIRTGWQTIDGKKYYYDQNGQPTIGWKEIDGKQYYFDILGEMQTGWLSFGDVNFYLDQNGVMQTGWQTIDKKWYYFDDEGQVKTGWYPVGSKWYYANSAGVMQTGWLKLGSRWYFLEGSGAMKVGWKQIGKKWYYFDSSGMMKTGWYQDGKKWYYSDSSGAMKTGWLKLGKKWYYLGSDGKMRTGWYQVGKTWYLSDGSGAMKTGWQSSGGKWYLLSGSGAMKTGWQRAGGKWYYLGSDGKMRTGWEKVGKSWYWFDNSGRMIASVSRRIGKKTYRFNGSGICLNP